MDDTKRVIYLNRIMQWFKGDFGGEKGIKRIISKYIGVDAATYRIKFKEYDWSEDLKKFTSDDVK